MQGRHYKCAVIKRRVLGTLLLAVLCLLGGCMTPEKAERETESVWTNKVIAAWQQVPGRTNAFDFAEPAEMLRLRLDALAETQGLHEVAAQLKSWDVLDGEPVLTNGFIKLSLNDALRIGAKNDRTYQNHKQSIYNAALSFDTAGHKFENSFSGFLLGAIQGDPEATRLTGDGGAGVTRTFSSGAKLTANLAFSVAQLLKSDFTSGGLVGDASFTMPLLRGAGKDIVLEPMIQTERNLLYSIRDFEYYRQQYAVSVARSYFDVLSSYQRIRIAEANEESQRRNKERADSFYKANRWSIVEYGQAEQSYLTAVNDTVNERQNYANNVDTFVILIGLPPASPVVLDEGELEHMKTVMEKIDQLDPDKLADRYPQSSTAIEIALSQRLDLLNTFDTINDAERKLNVARDNLRADLTPTVSGKADRSSDSDTSGTYGDENWDARVRADLPWDRRQERNLYRSALLAVDNARRNYINSADSIRKTIRKDLRTIQTLRQTYIIQKRATALAFKRQESNRMLQDAGRATMRDVLEADRALLSAQNDFLAATVNWRMTELDLKRDMGSLQIDAAGLWQAFEDVTVNPPTNVAP